MTNETRELVERARGHTPGPWFADRESIWCTLENQAVVEIARTNVLEELHAQWAYANAHLIAAAPTLLAAIQSLSERNAVLESRLRALHEALTPSAETKAEYIGEFQFPIELAHPRLGSETRSVDVPWTTIKTIMAAILGRAALTPQVQS
jgi:hypothetical protein